MLRVGNLKERFQALQRIGRRGTTEILAREGVEHRARAERVEGKDDGDAQYNEKYRLAVDGGDVAHVLPFANAS